MHPAESTASLTARHSHRPSASAGASQRSDSPPEAGIEGRGVSDAAFRQVMGVHAAGVVVVTAPGGPRPVGVTATSFSSVSADPPLVSFYLNAESSSWPGVREAHYFAVNILDDSQREVAIRFATKGIDRFAAPTRWSRGPADLPLLEGALGHVLCRRYDLLAIGDHWLIVGRVVDTAVRDDGQPLLYQRGRYGSFTPTSP
ncbi:flavin reductase family protein [Salinactinospora qingdaonensis]|uniref:flavin reductase family protein n=1 Tax=Salinactinospora qingdaonensis TaxID=702744 RepID=UPI0031E903FC